MTTIKRGGKGDGLCKTWIPFSRFLFHALATSLNFAPKEFLQQVVGEMVSISIIQLQTLFLKICNRGSCRDCINKARFAQTSPISHAFSIKGQP